jgi:hypothetical protein
VQRADWDRRYDTGEFVWDVHPNRFLAEEVAAAFADCTMSGLWPLGPERPGR